jgi:hypothetical protein
MAPIRPGAWLASLAAVASLAASVAGCSPKPKDTPAPPPAPAAEPALSLPVPPPAIERAELLAIIGQAASAFAQGQTAPRTVLDLVGRRFSVRLPFGCLGPGGDGPASYAYDAGKTSLKLTARPQTWTKDETVRALVAGPTTETIEGFWIPRPWIAEGACPALRPQPIPVPPAPAPFPHTVGLVSTFEAKDSRLQQRGARPYEVVRKAETPPAGAFHLILEGRIVEGPTGPVVCRSDDPDHPPLCLLRVEFDRVAIEDATGEVLGEWR